MKKVLMAMLAFACMMSSGFLFGNYNVAAFEAAREDYGDYRVVIETLSPEGNYLTLFNNDMTPPNYIALVVTMFVADFEVDLSTLGAYTVPDGANLILQTSFGADGSFALNPGSARLVSSFNGLKLSENVNGEIYYTISFGGRRPKQSYKIDYRDCLDEAKGNWNNLECRAAEKDGSLVYEAYYIGGTEDDQEKVEGDLGADGTEDGDCEDDALDNEEVAGDGELDADDSGVDGAEGGDCEDDALDNEEMAGDGELDASEDEEEGGEEEKADDALGLDESGVGNHEEIESNFNSGADEAELSNETDRGNRELVAVSTSGNIDSGTSSTLTDGKVVVEKTYTDNDAVFEEDNSGEENGAMWWVKLVSAGLLLGLLLFLLCCLIRKYWWFFARRKDRKERENDIVIME